jgi:hypothetical protein
MEALAEQFLEKAPLDYDSDTATDEDPPDVLAFCNLGLQTCAAIFKNALENRTASKKAFKNHHPQARAPATQDNQTRWHNTF